MKNKKRKKKIKGKINELSEQKFFLKRPKCGFYEKINLELKSAESTMYKNFLRMSSSDFDYLLSIIGPFIAKQNTCMRDATFAGERLEITLSYLASGKIFSFKYLFIYLFNNIFY
jgi:flagellar assembly factor FliW